MLWEVTYNKWVIPLFWNIYTEKMWCWVLYTFLEVSYIVKLVYVEIMCFNLPYDQLRSCTYPFMDQ